MSIKETTEPKPSQYFLGIVIIPNKYSQYTVIKMVVPDEIKKWNLCVQQAKAKHHISTKFGFVDRRVIKDARKCYCAMSFIKTK